MERIHELQEEKKAFWVKSKQYEQDLDYMECVSDIFDNPVFQSMDNYLQHGDTTCREHCIMVSYMSYCICRKFGWEYAEVARAGLLHDLFLYDWHTHAKETGNHFHGFTHPRTALENAEKYFDLTEKEKDMILRHMWPLTPIPPKSRGGLVIVYSDKYCGLKETISRVKRWFLCMLGWERVI
jgi:uncharacterized protein